MEVKFKKLTPDAITPNYAKSGDAGLDLYATTVSGGSPYQLFCNTGIAIEIPEGYVGLIFPRSSISSKTLDLANSVGVIDSGYRGEIKFIFNVVDFPEYQGYNVGDKIGQLIILPFPKIELKQVEELSNSDRGIGGFGSTGK